MSLTLAIALTLITTGLVAGLTNTAATGGGLILFIVLSAVTGDPLVANATALMVMPFSFASKFRHLPRHPEHARLFLVAGAGCAAGVTVLATLGGALFATAAPWFVLGATGLLVAEPVLRRWRGSNTDSVSVESSAGLPTLLGLFAVSIYAGVFGASFGTLVLAVLVCSMPFAMAAPTKNLICLATSLVGMLTIPLLRLPFDWHLAAILAVPMFIGGLLGERLLARLTRSQSVRTTRRLKVFVVLVSLVGVGMLLAS